jgi:tRNA pseudouridine38-40 synthase
MKFLRLIIFIPVLKVQSLALSSMKTAKRKVMLVGGYLGTNYYGLQMNPSPLPTVENEIRKGLFKAGYIAATNSEDLSKIGWSRSSRTDKGVSAGRIAFTGKLEFSDAQSPPAATTISFSGRNQQPVVIPEVVSKTNFFLPPDIRLFSCIRVGDGFSARSACFWRSYDYILPLDVFQPSPLWNNETALLEKFNFYLKQLEGCNDFHNYHRLSGKELKNKGKTRRIQRNDMVELSTGKTQPEEPGNDEEEENEEIGEAEPTEDHLDSSSNVFNVYESSIQVPRYISMKTRSIVYRCHADIFEHPSTKEKYFKITITGQHFLLQ